MVFQNNLLMGAAAATSGTTAFDVKYSCRFNSGDSAYLTRTPGSDGNLKKFTINVWVKRCGLGANTYILKTTNSGYSGWLGFGGTAVDRITWAMESSATGGPMNYNPDIKYRDPNAWYNLHMVWDTAQPSKNSRARVYINGIQNDIELATFPNEDADSMQFNKAIAHEIARYGSAYFDGYLAQYCFIDGSALFPTSFGEFDDYGVWRPVDPSGLTFGTNGFYLDFADSSDLGNDVSGNNNDFTSSGLTAADQVPDTPTKNYCVFNAINKSSTFTLSDGNLTSTQSATSSRNSVGGTMYVGPTGKYYFEITCVTNANEIQIGVGGTIMDITSTAADQADVWWYRASGEIYGNGTEGSSGDYSTFTNGDVIQVAVDMDASKIWFGKNGTFVGDPAAGSGEAFSTLPDYVTPVSNAYLAGVTTLTCGQVSFAHSAPTGFKEINTANLSTSNILNGKKYFDTILYEGNGDTQKIGQFQPITESFTVGNSALFIDGDSCTLSKTFSSTPTSDRQGTFSWWFKRGKVQDQVTMLSQTHPGSGSRDTIYVSLSSADILTVSMETASGTAIVRTTNRKFADTTQWVNIVIRIDGTQTDDSCMKIYINGVQLTDFSSKTNLGSSTDLELGSGTNPWTWGTLARYTSGNYYDGYMSEIVYCDGQLLDSDSFGEVDSTTNRWIPKDVSGLTFGNNGYYLNMADKNDLGDDESGNTNDFTESGLDTTNGSNQFYDTPTRNFATMDPGRAINETITKGNLLGTSGGATGQTRVPNPFGVSSGKWYFEYLMTNGTTNERTMYVTQDDIAVSATQIRSLTGHYSGYYSYDGNVQTPGDPTSTTGASASYGATYTSGDVISCALDLDIGAIWWGKNGTWQNSATEAEIEAGTVTNAADTGLTNGKKWFPTMQNNTTQASQMNFGQHIYFDSTALSLNTDAGGYFRHDVPDGFKALNVDNLSDSASYQSAFSWIKNRDAADANMLFDRPRGIQLELHSDSTAVETTDRNSLQRFLKQGVTVGEDEEVNTANESYVLWDWFIESTGSGSSNTDGSLNTTKTLADTTSGMSIGLYEGTGSATTMGHGLGKVPTFWIVRNRESVQNWMVYHVGTASDPQTDYLTLQSNADVQDHHDVWNDTAPTSSVISLGSDGTTNNSGSDFVSYIFTDITGFSKFSYYIGNGADDGTFVNLGFQPAWLMIKRSDSTGDWIIYDTKRSRFNPVDDQLLANSTAAETTGSEEIDILANGFKCRTSDSYLNASGGRYLFAAFAKNPFGGDETSPMTAF